MPTRGKLSGSRRKGLSGSPLGGKGERGKQGPVHQEPALLLGRHTNRHDSKRNKRGLIDLTVRQGETRREHGCRLDSSPVAADFSGTLI
jgi:hypothetical protein